MEFVIVLVVLVAVVIFVSAPFRRTPVAAGASAGAPGPALAAGEVAELQAAREAKYREIRDADLDHRTGKLSDEDYAALDGTLRAEAVEILHRLDSINTR